MEKHQLRLKFYRFRKWYQLKIKVIIGFSRVFDTAGADGGRSEGDGLDSWCQMGWSGAGGGKEEALMLWMTVQHMLTKRFSNDPLRISTQIPLFSHPAELGSLRETASKPLSGCVVTAAPVHERKTCQLGNKVIKCSKGQLQCRVMISLEGETVQSMTR